jgi:hypothetical protein
LFGTHIPVGWLTSWVDGGWFDITTVAVALLLAVVKCFWHGHSFVSRQTGNDVVHGVAVFPLVMLCGSVLSKEIIGSLLKASPIIFSVAGLVALFAILEAEFERDEPL